MRPALLIASIMLMSLPAASFGQTAEPTPADGTAVQAQKRKACRQAGVAKGLKGPDLSDHIAVCMAEARVDCLKQAVSQKIRGRERSDFVRRCVTS